MSWTFLHMTLFPKIAKTVQTGLEELSMNTDLVFKGYLPIETPANRVVKGAEFVLSHWKFHLGGIPKDGT